MKDISEHIYHHLMDTCMKCKEHVCFLQSSAAAKRKEYFQIKKVYHTDSKVAI